MFKVVGKGVFSKEVLMNKLQEWGIMDVHTVIRKVEREKRCACGNIRILLVM